MKDTRALVAEAVAATRVHPPARYAWFGVMSPRLSARAARMLSPRATRDYLVDELAGRLYADFYRRGRAEPTRWQLSTPSADRGEFEAALSAANQGQGFLDDGWRVLGTDRYGVRVVKDGLELTVRASDLAGPAAADAQTALRLPKELFGVSPGFYMVCGDRPVRGGRMVRLYWNLLAEGAAPFVAAATRLLNPAAAFRLKVLNDPAAFGRCDAGVIYLAREDFPAVAELIFKLQAEIADLLSPRTPVFTEALAPGLGFAEDIGTGRSFGEHRCRLLAEALVASHESGTEAVMDTVDEHFTRAGVDLDRAHLSPAP